MPKMSQYAKVYSIKRVREFPSWNEKVTPVAVDDEPEAYVFIHENFVVTAGVFVDEKIVFDSITPEWIEFCTTRLGFAIPSDLPLPDESTESMADAASS